MEKKSKTEEIKRKTILSTLSLFFQSGYSALLGLVANLVLTILFKPAIFGIYITVLSIISLLNYFSDIGLAASLIQKDKIEDDDVKTTFTVQQILVVLLVMIGFLSTYFVRKFYSLPQEGIKLYWALLISFFISSLKTIPSVFLERKIQFQKIVLVQIVENTVFYITVIILALLGHSLLSFAYGVLLRAVVGLVLIYYLSFWKPRIGISFKSLKKLLKFGVPFQASSFLALFKDDLINLFLGKVIGFQGLGYIGWAKKWAEAPIRIVMDNISRVSFPVMARFQDEKEKISRLIEKILYYQTAILIPIMAGIILMMPLLIEVLPKYSKWRPALPLFYIFAIATFFISYSTPFINLFNALGKANISFVFMLVWTILTWVLVPVLSARFGIYGFPTTILILSTSFIVVLRVAKRLVSFNFIKQVKPFVISTLVMSGSIMLVVNYFNNLLYSLFIIVLTGVVVYIVNLKLMFKIDLLNKAIDLLELKKNNYGKNINHHCR